MNHELFLVEQINIAPNISLNLLFEKQMNLRELVECHIQIEIQLDDTRFYKKTRKFNF